MVVKSLSVAVCIELSD